MLPLRPSAAQFLPRLLPRQENRAHGHLWTSVRSWGRVVLGGGRGHCDDGSLLESLVVVL